MSWRRTRTLSTVLFVSLAFNLFLGGAMVEHWGWNGGGHHEHGSKHWGAKLWLSRALGDETAPKVEKMWQAQRLVMKPLREDAKQARKSIRQILPAEPFDAAAYDPALNTKLESGTAARARATTPL
jgi:Spy/CpxP family protein refolding chaperone